MKLVVLDRYALREGDLDFSPLHALVGEFVTYPRTTDADLIERIGDAELAILCKGHIVEEVLCACKNLRWIGVTATGVDNIDLAACTRHGVLVANVPSYSTRSVQQLAFAFLLGMCQHPSMFDASVRDGHWQMDISAPHAAEIFPMMEVFGKTLGILGYGEIGRQMARSARVFGMKVLVHTRTVRPEFAKDDVEFVSLGALLAASDIISLHCPLTPDTRGILNAENLAKCKRGVRIINTARGLLVDEQAMADALCSGAVGAFAADVVATEPMRADNPLLGAPHTMLTPHIAWATPEALGRLSATLSQNVASFLKGNPSNICNPR